MNLLYNIITRNDFQYSVFNTQFEYQPLKFASALSKCQGFFAKGKLSWQPSFLDTFWVKSNNCNYQ